MKGRILLIFLLASIALLATCGAASATQYYALGYCFPAGSVIYLDNGVNGVAVSGADGYFQISTTSPSGPNGHGLRFTGSGYYEETQSFNFWWDNLNGYYYYNAGTVSLTQIPQPTPTPTPAPTAGFTGSPTSGTVPLTVQFDSSSSHGIISSYDWNFGDGTAHGTTANPSHQYTVAGTYTVVLTVTGPGGSNAMTRTNYITASSPLPAAPVASFTGSPTSGIVPLTVQFDSSGSTGTITSYAWNFGDGTANATTANPSHQYTTAGTYTVVLTVTGPGGSTGQQRTNYITVSTVATPTPTPAPTPDPNLNTNDGAIGNLANTYLYCSNYYSGSISVLGVNSPGRITDIGTSPHPSDIIVGRSGTYIYVSYTDSTYLDVFTTIDYSRVSHVQIGSSNGEQYSRMAQSPDGKYLYISLCKDNKIVMYSVESNTVINSVTLPAGAGPISIVYALGKVYVGERDGHNLRVLDPVTLSTTTTYSYPQVGYLNNGNQTGPYDLGYDPYYGRVFASNGNNTTSVFDYNGFVGYLTSNSPTDTSRSVAANNTGYIYRANGGSNSISIFAPNLTQVGTINMPTEMGQIISNPYNTTIYVTGYGNGNVYTINGNSILYYVPVGNGPTRLCIGTQATPAVQLTQFKLTTLGYIGLDGVPVAVYLNGNLLYTGITDGSGTFACYLNPTSTYQIKYNSPSNGVNSTYTITPSNSYYQFDQPIQNVIGGQFGSLIKPLITSDSFGNQSQVEYHQSADMDQVSGTGYINGSYVDYSGKTTGLTFKLYGNNSTFGGTPTLLATQMAGASGNYNFTIPGAAGNSYYVEIDATQSGGSVKKYYPPGVMFPGEIALARTGIPLSWLFYIGMAVPLFIWGAGVITRRGYMGFIGTCAAGIIGYIGWYRVYIPDVLFWSAFTACFLLSIGVIIVDTEKWGR